MIVRVFHVRPERRGGYGRGDGASFAHAWNGLASVDWGELRGAPATLKIHDSPRRPRRFLRIEIVWNPLESHAPAARPDPRREPAVAV